MSVAHGQAVCACLNACDDSGTALTEVEWQLVFAGIATAAMWGQEAVMGDPQLQAVTVRCLQNMSQASGGLFGLVKIGKVAHLTAQVVSAPHS